MPEGPEIYALNLSLTLGGYKTQCYGKHLLVNDKAEDWSFGLNGRVILDSAGNLSKNTKGYITGSIKTAESMPQLVNYNKLGVDFITGSTENIRLVIEKWKNSRKTLGGLMLDQSHIAGIGVAWGSEILNLAGLKPDVPAKDQELSKLADSIISTRDYILPIYTKFVSEQPTMEFVNGWFDNLYAIRNMKVYKNGVPIETGGRRWWVAA